MPPISDVKLLDCMEGMAAYPDKFFNLCIVDPPYGLEGRVTEGGNSNSQSRKFRESYRNKKWDTLPDEKYWNELFRVSRNQIVCGSNYFQMPPSRGIVFWDKKQRMPTFSSGELIWTSFDKPAKIFEFQSTDNNRFHPTQKPVALYEWLLRNYAKPGDKILDTHLGSGSSRIAAYKLGFDFYGFEIDKDYFDAADKRFLTSIAMPLFDSFQNVAEQAKLF